MSDMAFPRGAVPKLTLDEFQFALSTGEAAARLKTPTISVPERTPTFAVEGFGSFKLADHPQNRFGLAVMEAFSHDREKGVAANYRLLYFGDVYRHPEMKNWSRDVPGEPEAMEVETAIFEAMATIPALYGKRIEPRKVFDLAKEIKAREDSEEMGAVSPKE